MPNLRVLRGTPVVALATLMLGGCGATPVAMDASGATALSAAAARPSVMGGVHPIYFNGTACYGAIEDLVDHAKESVYVETFNFEMGPSEQEVCDHLIARSKAGIKVRVLIDQCGNFKAVETGGGVPAYLRAGGVEVLVYKARSLGHDGLNIDHRKLYLADGVRGLTGGMNLRQDFHDTRHDMLVGFEGDTVAQSLHREFLIDWKAAGGAAFTMPTATFTPSSDTVLVTSPLERRYEIRDALYGAIEDAKTLVQVESPYLSDDGLVSRLKMARWRGVKVQILAPGANSSPVFKMLNTEAANELIQMGAEVRLYMKSYSHVKYFAVDGNWALFGSANGDNRAMCLNQELSVAVHDPALIAALDQNLYQPDWATATPVTSFPPVSWIHHAFTSILELVDYYI